MTYLFFHEIHLKNKCIKVAYKGMIVILCDICTINIPVWSAQQDHSECKHIREATKGHKDQKRTAFTPEECENLA